ncbi:haloacetate dehalogenase [Noviherbaspirillum humi]|uniref:Haloacetate dehalogenase n=1 Tax=Noviherbaspirillum humi TaxID=1688639 RepID=A0A239J4P1_9BURK|nr:alpha/beta hydrolase [Noviherbaspirillum humi]SNT00213.1 haloacetate dehalogenase [Noviherbaspirillum humi]
MLDRFPSRRIDVNGVTLHFRQGGDGPPLLLLHGYPQTHVIWHTVADQLAERFTLVMPDLRGYGDSSKPKGEPDHANYSKRVMAQDMAALMAALGHTRFQVCGHDRGGRVAHRLALDHPQAVQRLMLLDISPTRTMYDATDKAFASYYYHWFMLIQPYPLPETLIGNSAAFYLRTTLGGWGSDGASFFDAQAMAEYERCFCQPDAIHAACEDYRAAAGIDLAHDAADEDKRIACPVRVLWGEQGVVGRLFQPIADWQAKCAQPVTGRALPCGHFIPDQVPELLLPEMLAFFDAAGH